MKRLFTLLLVAFAAAAPLARAEVSVFDLPGLHLQHLSLLARMDAAHEAGAFGAMERACREGLALGTADALWSYNLACALALRGQAEAALDALARAAALGFRDRAHALEDPDLAALRDAPDTRERFAALAAGMADTRPPPDGPVPLRADADGRVLQTASNTVWSFSMGLFHALVAAPTGTPFRAYAGPEAARLRAWHAAGESAGCDGVLYVNRDAFTRPLDVARFPGLLRLDYAPEMVDRRLHVGLPNTLFAAADGSALLPAVGHSSMGYLQSPYWRSQPRAVCGDPRQLARQAALLLGNQLFFYPAYGDYDLSEADLFPANTPYAFAVVGGTHAEAPFLDAALAALAAFRPETRASLARTGLLMPTLHRLFRLAQRSVRGPADYLTGVAHPPAFQASELDAARLVGLAHGLATNDLPPLVLLNVRDETETLPQRDYFDRHTTETLFDSPLAVARVFRGAPRTRTFAVHLACRNPDAAFRWSVLQGDPARVTVTPCPTNSRLLTVTVAHHEPFRAPVAGGKTILTSRVDLGFFAETAGGLSLPSILSVFFLGNERRTYAPDGRLVSIDYTRPTLPYTDPLLSTARNWKDLYEHDAQGRVTGWVRVRGLARERFTAYGHRVVATDALGRATRAHVVRYLPRHVKTDEESEAGVPDLAQMDDNLEVAYRYRSDDDRVGEPDPDSLTQATAPPASEP